MTGSRTDVRLEDMGEATLLAIFKPEVVVDTKPATSSSVVAGTKSTSDLLARLKAGKGLK